MFASTIKPSRYQFHTPWASTASIRQKRSGSTLCIWCTKSWAWASVSEQDFVRDLAGTKLFAFPKCVRHGFTPLLQLHSLLLYVMKAWGVPFGTPRFASHRSCCLFFLVDVDVFGVDDSFVLLLVGGA